MLTRRHFLIVTAAALVMRPGLRAFANSAAERASAFVKTTGDQLVGVVNGPGSTEEKRRRLQQVINNAVDVD